MMSTTLPTTFISKQRPRSFVLHNVSMHFLSCMDGCAPPTFEGASREGCHVPARKLPDLAQEGSGVRWLSCHRVTSQGAGVGSPISLQSRWKGQGLACSGSVQGSLATRHIATTLYASAWVSAISHPSRYIFNTEPCRTLHFCE